MCGLLSGVAEVLPFGVDGAGIWLASGRDTLDPRIGPWRSGPIAADSTVQFAAEHVLVCHDVNPAVVRGVRPLPAEWPEHGELRALHSPSWRQDGPHIVCTYFALLDTDGPVIARFPGALPVGPVLAARWGPARAHGPAEEPVVDYGHVILHALRHLRFLVSEAMQTARLATDPARAEDAEVCAALVEHPHWYRHLDALTPALAGMYRGRVA